MKFSSVIDDAMTWNLPPVSASQLQFPVLEESLTLRFTGIISEKMNMTTWVQCYEHT